MNAQTKAVLREMRQYIKREAGLLDPLTLLALLSAIEYSEEGLTSLDEGRTVGSIDRLSGAVRGLIALTPGCTCPLPGEPEHVHVSGCRHYDMYADPAWEAGQGEDL